MNITKSNTNLIRKIRFYPDCLFFLLDVWLKRMSQKGYHLVNYGFCTYTFEKGKPEEREYFSYSCEAIGEGCFSIPLRYPGLNKTYGKNKKKSKLNKNVAKKTIGVYIVEIDTERISLVDHVGYKELRKDRNKLYCLKTLRAIAVVALFLLILIVAEIMTTLR